MFFNFFLDLTIVLQILVLYEIVHWIKLIIGHHRLYLLNLCHRIDHPVHVHSVLKFVLVPGIIVSIAAGASWKSLSPDIHSLIAITVILVVLVAVFWRNG